MNRFFSNIFTTRYAINKYFPPSALDRIEAAIKVSESTHTGEICLAIENYIPISLLLKSTTARDRAVEYFSHGRIWDTEHNVGVLIYLLLSERKIEIVADRGIDSKVSDEEWQKIATKISVSFKNASYEDGVKEGIKTVSEHLKKHFPRTNHKVNELSDRPVIIR